MVFKIFFNLKIIIMYQQPNTFNSILSKERLSPKTAVSPDVDLNSTKPKTNSSKKGNSSRKQL